MESLKENPSARIKDALEGAWARFEQIAKENEPNSPRGTIKAYDDKKNEFLFGGKTPNATVYLKKTPRGVLTLSLDFNTPQKVDIQGEGKPISCCVITDQFLPSERLERRPNEGPSYGVEFHPEGIPPIRGVFGEFSEAIKRKIEEWLSRAVTIKREAEVIALRVEPGFQIAFYQPSDLNKVRRTSQAVIAHRAGEDLEPGEKKLIEQVLEWIAA